MRAALQGISASEPLEDSGRQAAALGDQSVIFGIDLGSVGLESRICHGPINLFSLPDWICFGFSATLWYINTIDASTIEPEDLLFERRRQLRIAVRLN